MKKSRSPHMQPLNFLIGTWHTTGEVKGGEHTPTTPLSGTDTYEWILSNHFILHKVAVKIGDESVEALEIIGPSDGDGATYSFRSFDHQGAFTQMEGYLDDDGALRITGDKMRSKLTVADPNTMTAHWEKSEDNQEWMPWMDLTLRN